MGQYLSLIYTFLIILTVLSLYLKLKLIQIKTVILSNQNFNEKNYKVKRLELFIGIMNKVFLLSLLSIILLYFYSMYYWDGIIEKYISDMS